MQEILLDILDHMIYLKINRPGVDSSEFSIAEVEAIQQGVWLINEIEKRGFFVEFLLDDFNIPTLKVKWVTNSAVHDFTQYMADSGSNHVLTT